MNLAEQLPQIMQVTFMEMDMAFGERHQANGQQQLIMVVKEKAHFNHQYIRMLDGQLQVVHQKPAQLHTRKTEVKKQKQEQVSL